MENHGNEKSNNGCHVSINTHEIECSVSVISSNSMTEKDMSKINWTDVIDEFRLLVVSEDIKKSKYYFDSCSSSEGDIIIVDGASRRGDSVWIDLLLLDAMVCLHRNSGSYSRKRGCNQHELLKLAISTVIQRQVPSLPSEIESSTIPIAWRSYDNIIDHAHRRRPHKSETVEKMNKVLSACNLQDTITLTELLNESVKRLSVTTKSTSKVTSMIPSKSMEVTNPTAQFFNAESPTDMSSALDSDKIPVTTGPVSMSALFSPSAEQNFMHTHGRRLIESQEIEERVTEDLFSCDIGNGELFDIAEDIEDDLMMWKDVVSMAATTENRTSDQLSGLCNIDTGIDTDFQMLDACEIACSIQSQDQESCSQMFSDIEDEIGRAHV